jgi:hypothetical protein
VLTTRGLIAWARTLAALSTTSTSTSTPIGTASPVDLPRQRSIHEPPVPVDLPPDMAAELINVLAAIALADPVPP